VKIVSTVIRTKLVLLQLAILVPLLILVAVIQVLPQIDLPDTAFHRGTAPIITKSRSVAAPAFNVVIQRSRVGYVHANTVASLENSLAATHRVDQSLPILHSALLC
jgi:hypothetical protein